jgi:hypothetical protein
MRDVPQEMSAFLRIKVMRETCLARRIANVRYQTKKTKIPGQAKKRAK